MMTTPGSISMGPGLPEEPTPPHLMEVGVGVARDQPVNVRPSVAPGVYIPEQLNFNTNSQSSESHIPPVSIMETIVEEGVSVYPSYNDNSTTEGPDRTRFRLGQVGLG